MSLRGSLRAWRAWSGGWRRTGRAPSTSAASWPSSATGWCGAALALAEVDLENAGHGRAPVAYSWLVAGSEGRREQTLKTDQDNGLVYRDPPAGAEAVSEASFDLRFLEPEARRLDLSSLTRGRPILDTRLLSRALHGPGADHSLEAIALRLGVEVRGRHSALGDALTTAEIFVRLIALLKKRGVRTLGEALDAIRRARTPQN